MIPVKRNFFASFLFYQLQAKHLTTAILWEWRKLGLILDHLRGQGYDRVSNMSAEISGVQEKVKEEYFLAMYAQCASQFKLSDK